MIGSKTDPDYLNGIGEVGLVKPLEFRDDTPFQFERGGEIASINLRYETYGELAANKENAILICHALTGDHHCAGVYSPEDAKPGWWNQMIGPRKGHRYKTILCNLLELPWRMPRLHWPNLAQ